MTIVADAGVCCGAHTIAPLSAGCMRILCYGGGGGTWCLVTLAVVNLAVEILAEAKTRNQTWGMQHTKGAGGQSRKPLDSAAKLKRHIPHTNLTAHQIPPPPCMAMYGEV